MKQDVRSDGQRRLLWCLKAAGVCRARGRDVRLRPAPRRRCHLVSATDGPEPGLSARPCPVDRLVDQRTGRAHRGPDRSDAAAVPPPRSHAEPDGERRLQRQSVGRRSRDRSELPHESRLGFQSSRVRGLHVRHQPLGRDVEAAHPGRDPRHPGHPVPADPGAHDLYGSRHDGDVGRAAAGRADRRVERAGGTRCRPGDRSGRERRAVPHPTAGTRRCHERLSRPESTEQQPHQNLLVPPHRRPRGVRRAPPGSAVELPAPDGQRSDAVADLGGLRRRTPSHAGVPDPWWCRSRRGRSRRLPGRGRRRPGRHGRGGAVVPRVHVPARDPGRRHACWPAGCGCVVAPLASAPIRSSLNARS